MAKSRLRKRSKRLIKKLYKLSRVQVVVLVVLAAGMGFLIWNIFASSTGPFSTRFTVFGNDTGAPQCGIPAKEGYTVAFDVDKITADVRLPAAERAYCGKYIHVTNGPYAGRYLQIVDGCGACRGSQNGGNSFARIDLYCNYPESAKDFLSVCAARGLRDSSPSSYTTYLTSSKTSSSGTPNYTPPANFSLCSYEGSHCSFTGTRDVAYGANGKFFYRSAVTNGIDCSNSWFNVSPNGNGGDPDQGIKKACFTFHLPSGYTLCANENNFCAYDGIDKVVYGAKGGYSNRYGYGASDTYWGPSYGIAGDRGIWCNNSNFPDAASGYTKHCYSKEVLQSSYSCSNHPTVGSGYTTTGTCVSRVQYILRKTASYESNAKEDPNTINASFGTSTYNAVYNFQANHYKAGTSTHLGKDGVVGPDTWGALEGQCTYINTHNRYELKC